jgi:hypothetical protein
MVKKYFHNIMIAADQFINALFGGDPDETVSSRTAKYIRKGTDNKFILLLAALLEKIDPGHLKRSIEEDEGKDQII